MDFKVDAKIEVWKKKLLDLGKRNRLINFRETKRSNINILEPSLSDLYNSVVIAEEELRFSYPIEKNIDEEVNMFSDDESELEITVIEGDVETNQSITEQQKTLKSLRSKARTALEEQGVNVLYLAFGFLTWKESVQSSQLFKSPILLVPVTLSIASLTSPYKIKLHDDEIVVNPTLKYKLENDFNIVFPEFDSENDDVEAYLNDVRELISSYGWIVEDKVSLAMFSFLKINMYMDLHKHNESLKENFAVRALCGDHSSVVNISDDLVNYDHDKMDIPKNVYQTVDADSSQQDAITLSKKGVSFVLQGPPGTGKSQTITNIISEALADGKKVLFVSEKMAALDVVYKRLTKVGLSDFCLTLHNHKANKKEILKNLRATLDLQKMSIRDEVIYELNTLSKERDKLNDYVRELHIVQEPMHKSIYQVNGILAKLENAPNIIFNMNNVNEMSSDNLRDYGYMLDNFAVATTGLNQDYDSNVWRGCNVNYVSHTLRHDLETKTLMLVTEFTTFIDKINSLFNKVEYPSTISWDVLDEILEVFQLCSKAFNIPRNWLDNHDIGYLCDMTDELSAKQSEYMKAVDFIDDHYSDGIYDIDIDTIKCDIYSAYDELLTLLNKSIYISRKDIYSELCELIKASEESLKSISNIINITEDIGKILELPMAKTIEEGKKQLVLMRDLSQQTFATSFWLEKQNHSSLNGFLDELDKQKIELANLRKTILLNYDNNVFEIDYSNILIRYKTEYTGIFKVFKASYKHDMNILKSYRNIPINKITYAEALSLLNAIQKVKDLESSIKAGSEIGKLYFGELYLGEITDTLVIRRNLDLFNKIADSLEYNFSSRIKDILLSRLNNKLENEIIKLDTGIQDDGLINGFALVDKSIDDDISFADLYVEINKINAGVLKLEREYQVLKKYSTNEMSYANIEDSFSYLQFINKFKENANERKSELDDIFQFLYTGINVDWNNIKRALLWTSSFKDSIAKKHLDKKFVDNVLSLTFGDDIEQIIAIIKSLKLVTNSNFEWLNSLFEIEYQMYNKPLGDVVGRIERFILNLHDLEKWIDFNNVMSDCCSNGLKEVVDALLLEKIQPVEFKNSFEKRFYKLWLDAIIPKYPSVFSFRRDAREKMIETFRKYDTNQMRIAELRVRARLIDNLPNLNSATSAHDEVGILIRELGKQRKIMPIRKLFSRIPNLLPTLKPCLMMSPLSVSLFLESELYKFDLVIFDEASQVCTENSIGAIMRSKQVIVAGDNKQLPPTNFFAATTSDGDYDVESDDDIDDGDFESILDEMVTVFPERSLKWHYRSKNEQLITFSNIKIYNQSLITFPSSVEDVADNGVEYVYVENGVYDRGGKKNNINEAKRVAKLVYEHYKKANGRSVGVIAFSEAQQQAIDDEVIKLQRSDPMFDAYINQEKEESFFIKNLENVQGDERDTIIFSIGYAKDSAGVMYMNFGPLSRNGGYRRLNVAITRAKYNIKLVGSIRPTDIRLENTNSEGVKMLRSYIDFAISGKSVLENELRYNRIVDVDSPFEEAIYDFLVAKGYDVTTQVGCSGYRIDMAVNHPELDGRFVIGIECDGAAYHSSRTARERDRLRQTVLEDMGWKFHRIWSTDWIKDPVKEGKILVDAIEKAISSYQDNFESYNSTDTYEPESIDVYYDQVVEAHDENDAGEIKFDTYVESNPRSVLGGGSNGSKLCNAILHVVDVEYPIHYELLCKRIAPLYGNQKATVKIRKEVNFGIARIGDEIICINSYYYPKNYTEVLPKSPGIGEDPRAIDNISTDEICAGMLIFINKSYGITKESLFQVLAKGFGFNRTGAKIVNAFERAFNELIENQKIQYVEDKVIVL